MLGLNEELSVFDAEREPILSSAAATDNFSCLTDLLIFCQSAEYLKMLKITFFVVKITFPF